MRIVFPTIDPTMKVRALVTNDFGEGAVLVERPWPADDGRSKEWVIWSFGADGSLFSGTYIQEAFGRTIADAWAAFYQRSLRFGAAAHEA